MVSQRIDATLDFNTNGNVVLDVSEWDYVIVQLVTPTGTVTFKSSNDGGAVQGVTDGNASSATNFITVQGTDLNSGSAVTTLAVNGMVRFTVIGTYFQITGSSVTAAKVLIKFSKIE